MAHQDGWPLGLGALNRSVGTIKRDGLSSSISFSTAFTSSHYRSSVTSSDYDTQSARSFRHDGGMTLASLIGIVGVLDQRHRSSKVSMSGKIKAMLRSLCLRSHLDSGDAAAPSLGQFLEMERRASGHHVHRMSQSSARLLTQ